MKMDINEVAAITRKLRFKAPDNYLITLKENPRAVDQICNGVGSETSWTYHLTPDTIYGININPASHIHDWMYTFPEKFNSVEEGLEYKKLADDWFESNVNALIDDSKWSVLRFLRRLRLAKYMHMLREHGDEAFWSDKPLPTNYQEHYRKDT